MNKQMIAKSNSLQFPVFYVGRFKCKCFQWFGKAVRTCYIKMGPVMKNARLLTVDIILTVLSDKIFIERIIVKRVKKSIHCKTN